MSRLLVALEDDTGGFGMSTEWALVEKRNHSILHALFDSKERAEQHLAKVIPDYVAKRYFMDKTLTATDFEIIPYAFKRKGRR